VLARTATSIHSPVPLMPMRVVKSPSVSSVGTTAVSPHLPQRQLCKRANGSIIGQGRIIQQYYTGTCNSQPCQFIVGFGNPAANGVQYCQAYNDPHGQCINNQTARIYKNGAPDVRPATKKRSELESIAQAALFRMASGMEVLLRKSCFFTPSSGCVPVD